MPQRQPKAAIAAREEKLLRYYARAWKQVTDLQAAIAADPKQWRKARKLREAQHAIEAMLDDLDARALSWFSQEYPEIHALGVSAGARELGASAPSVWAKINPDAVAQLAADGFGDLLKATRLTRRTTKTMIRKVLEDEILGKLITGDTAVAAGRRAAQILERSGVHSVRYADGSRHGLREYANMAVRTKTAVAYNLGSLQAGMAEGVTKWEIFDGTCGLAYHDGPDANGMIVDIETALAYPISHPNCRRAFGGRPDLGPLPDFLKPPEGKVLEPSTAAQERARERTAARVGARARR